MKCQFVLYCIPVERFWSYLKTHPFCFSETFLCITLYQILPQLFHSLFLSMHYCNFCFAINIQTDNGHWCMFTVCSYVNKSVRVLVLPHARNRYESLECDINQNDSFANERCIFLEAVFGAYEHSCFSSYYEEPNENIETAQEAVLPKGIFQTTKIRHIF